MHFAWSSTPTAHNTTNDGLGIDVREGEAQHFGAPLFQRGDYAMHELDQLAQRHPHDADLSDILGKLRTRPSVREADGCSLTLTQTSQPLHACQRSVHNQAAMQRGGRRRRRG